MFKLRPTSGLDLEKHYGLILGTFDAIKTCQGTLKNTLFLWGLVCFCK